MPVHPQIPEHVVWTLLLFAPAIGASVGSFLNVCVFRMPREHLSVVHPGSHCFTCGTPLPWYENLPLVSWIALRGKCGHCRTAISPIYLGTEVLMALVFGWVCWAFFGTQYAFARFAEGGPEFGLYSPAQQGAALGLYLTLISALVASSWIDIRHRIIPDEISLGGTVLALVAAGCVPAMIPRAAWLSLEGSPHMVSLATACVGATVGAGTIGFVGVAGKAVFGREAMGMGDVKLMALLGAFLGWQGVLMTLFIACFIGAALGGASLYGRRLWRWIIGNKEKVDSYMPFGPYLALGAVLVLLFRTEIFDWLDWWLRGGRF